MTQWGHSSPTCSQPASGCVAVLGAGSRGVGCELGLWLGGSGESMRIWEFALEWVLAGTRDDSTIEALNISHLYGGTDWWEAEAVTGAEAAVTHIRQERVGSGVLWLGPHSCLVLFHHRPRVALADALVLWNRYLSGRAARPADARSAGGCPALLPLCQSCKGCLVFKMEVDSCTQSLSCSVISILATLWTVACQAPLSMGFSRQEYWSGLPFPSPGDLPDPGIEPTSLASPALAGRFFTTSATWEAPEVGSREKQNWTLTNFGTWPNLKGIISLDCPLYLNLAVSGPHLGQLKILPCFKHIFNIYFYLFGCTGS